jgi:hypothetical protein
MLNVRQQLLTESRCGTLRRPYANITTVVRMYTPSLVSWKQEGSAKPSFEGNRTVSIKITQIVKSANLIHLIEAFRISLPGEEGEIG